MLEFLEGKRVVVTGGAGAFGRNFLNAIKSTPPASVLVLSRDEMKHSALRREWTGKSWARFRIGDITRADDLELAFREADVVIHAAAMKHLPECELNAAPSTVMNVVGTLNVVNAFARSSASTLVFLSTDKAPYASTIYGAQKLIGEKLVTEAALAGKRAFSLRYSNVIDSTGAAFLLFKQLLGDGKTVTVNGAQTSRGFLSQAEVLRCLSKALEVARGGEVFVPVPRLIVIADMARTMRAILGKGDVVVNESPGFTGEKESATLIMAEEKGLTVEVPELDGPTGYLIDPLRRHGDRKPARFSRPTFSLEDCPRLEGGELRKFLETLM